MRRRGTAWVLAAIVLLLFSITVAIAGWGTDPQGSSLFYPGYLLYSSTSLGVAVLVLVLGLVALALWFVGGISTALDRIKPPASAALLIVLAGGILIYGSFPSLLVRVTETDAESAGGHRYYLTTHTAIDNQTVFVMYECDGAGVTCAMRYASRVYPVVRPEDLPVADLAAALDGSTIDLAINGEVIHQHRVAPPG
jgi:uncharacterized membrane protein YphA (DoxX/SURF4 family)